jgi:uncharacterized cofD-like protein
MAATSANPTGHRPRIVVIGGGTGSFTVLRALKDHACELTAIVNMIDDAGSSGLLRDELGVLPPGDIRQSLVALSTASSELRDLFNYRFPEGTFGGHAFGNLFITALEKMTGSIGQAVRVAGEVLSIRGRVIPASTDDVRLALKTADGRTIHGEDRIGEGPASDQLFIKGRPHHLYLEPQAHLNPEAQAAISAADLIVIAPGKLYSSILPSFLVSGMPEALRQSPAKIAYICNLMTRPNQTAGFTVTDFAAEVEHYAGGPILDFVIYNTMRPTTELLERYTLEGELPVEYDPTNLSRQHYQAVGQPLISQQPFAQAKHDTLLKRTLIRHDSAKLAQTIMNLTAK